MLNYLLYIITVLLGVISLIIKDWGAYRKSSIRFVVLFLIVMSGLGGAVIQYFSDIRAEKKEQKAQEQYQEDQKKMAGLKESVETADKNQQENTKQFVDAFSRLSQKMSDLQTQVKTAELKKEVAELQAELQKTRKALNLPKTVLTFTFGKPDLDNPPIRTVTLPVKNDVVQVEFAIRNETDIPALDAEINIVICDTCKFASEPPQSTKIPQIESRRFIRIPQILPRTVGIMITDIQVPRAAVSIDFGITYRCRNCTVPSDPSANFGTVYLDRRR